jgi:nucleoside phosphorylase
MLADRTLLAKALRVTDYPVVVCASADKFVDKRTERIALNKEFGAHICEMEAAGIQLIAMTNNIPALFVKTVSDGINGGFSEFAAVLDTAVTSSCGFFGKLLKVL